MTSPYSITWPASSTTYIAASQAIVIATPLVFANPVPSQNIFSSVVTLAANMPAGNLRTLTLTGTSLGATVAFGIIGVDFYGNILDETITLLSGSSTVSGTNIYASITSIIPGTTTTGTVSAGTGNLGATYWYIADTSNKNVQVTLAYDNIVGTVSLTPVYTLNLFSFVNGQIVYKTTDSTPALQTHPFPLANPNIIVSPSTITTLPITTTAAISFSGIPLQAIQTQLLVATTGSFVQTIIQQGGRF